MSQIFCFQFPHQIFAAEFKNRNIVGGLSFQQIFLQTKTKTEQDPTCVIFSKSRCSEDVEYNTEGGATNLESQKVSSINASAASAE